jgi:hypothetical protein
MDIITQLENLKSKKINFKNFKIDVGTAIDAPHSAHWIYNDDSVFVLGIEPNKKNTDILYEGSFRTPNFFYLRLKDQKIMINGDGIKTFNDNNFFILEKVAIDNVNTPSVMDFYCTDDRNTGCSSLLKPTSRLDLEVELVDQVNVVSLEYILDYINFPVEEKISFVKTDTQGKDFDVIKSLGKYLNNVVAIKSEFNTAGQYENSNSEVAFLSFMLENNFELYKNNGYDYFFYNKKYELNDNTFNLPNV